MNLEMIYLKDDLKKYAAGLRLIHKRFWLV